VDVGVKVLEGDTDTVAVDVDDGLTEAAIELLGEDPCESEGVGVKLTDLVLVLDRVCVCVELAATLTDGDTVTDAVEDACEEGLAPTDKVLVDEEESEGDGGALGLLEDVELGRVSCTATSDDGSALSNKMLDVYKAELTFCTNASGLT